MILATWTQFVLFAVAVASVLILSVPGNVQMGAFFFDSFQYDKAFEYYAGAMKNDGSNLKNLKKLKEYYLVMGDTKRALDLQESLVKLRPKNRSYHRELVSLYDWNRMPEEKLRAMESEASLMKGKERLDQLFEVAEGYRWLRLYEAATPIFRELALSENPLYLEAAINFFAATGQRDKVQELAPKVRPKGDPDVFLRWMAELAEAEGETELALDKYREIISTKKNIFHEREILSFDPGRIREKLAIIERVNRLLLKSGKLEEAIELQQKLSELFPENLTLAYDLGYFHLERKDEARALRTFRSILKKEKNPERVFDTCGVFVSLNREGEANQCLKGLTRQYPSNPRYLEGLAESFERLGEKREALRIYERILFLQGERDASIWRSQELILLAQNGPFDTRQLKKNKVIRKESLAADKLDELRQKVIYLREELGEGARSEKLMLSLVRRHPRNKAYLKQLAFHYLDNEQKMKGVEVMERVLKLDPRDPEALRVTLGLDAEMGRSEEVYRKLKLLEPLQDLSLLDLKFNVLVETSRQGELSEFCLENSVKHPELRFRCEFELGDKEVATSELEEFIKAQNREDLRPLLTIWKAELTELRKLKAARREWLLSGRSTQVVQTGSKYLLSEIDLLKKFDGPGIGLRVDSLQGANPFTLLSPYAYYGWESGEVKGGPSLDLSGRNLNTPFFIDASFFESSSFFLNLHYENSRPEYALRELQRSDEASRRFLSVYGSYRLPGHFYEASLDRNQYDFESESGSDIQLYAEYLKTEVFHPRWAFGVRAFLADLETDGERVRALHIQEALGYYAVAQYANSFLIPRYNRWNYQFKLAIGGDSQREIAFGEALNGRAQFEYFKTEKKGIRFYGEYFKESYLARISDMSLFGMQFLINF